MKKVFTSEFIAKLIMEVIILGGILFSIQKYFESKIAPYTAEETLKKENFLNAKRDIYFEAINILNKTLANSDFIIKGTIQDTTNRYRGGKYPTEIEVNSCFSKLCIYSNNQEIPLTFKRLFDTDDKNIKPIFEMAKFINLVRNDLGYGDLNIDTSKDQYKFISIHRKNF